MNAALCSKTPDERPPLFKFKDHFLKTFTLQFHVTNEPLAMERPLRPLLSETFHANAPLAKEHPSVLISSFGVDLAQSTN